MKRNAICVAIALALAAPTAALAQGADTDSALRKPQAAATLPTALVTAFGVVNAAGVKLSGTPNWAVTYDSTNKWYVITIVNESFYYSNYATVVTPQGLTVSAAVGCRTDSYSGALLVKCFTGANTPVQTLFSFRVDKY